MFSFTRSDAAGTALRATSTTLLDLDQKGKFLFVSYGHQYLQPQYIFTSRHCLYEELKQPDQATFAVLRIKKLKPEDRSPRHVTSYTMARGESPVLSRASLDSPRLRSSPGRNGSPSRQQLAEIELQKTIAKLTLHDVEQHKVYIAQKCAFQEELDAREEAQAVSQLSQIERAIATHNLAREQAEAVLQAHLDAEREKARQQALDQQRREEEEERRKQEAERRRAREEQERQIREQTEREEAAKRAEAERVRLEEERRRKEEEEAQRQEKERAEQERQKADAEAQAQAAKQREEDAKKTAIPAPAQPPAPRAAQPSTTSAQVTSSDIEQEHQSYLNIHKRLKKFRIDFWENCKSNKTYKSQVGEWRRGVRTAVGQLRLDGIEHNKVAVS